MPYFFVHDPRGEVPRRLQSTYRYRDGSCSRSSFSTDSLGEKKLLFRPADLVEAHFSAQGLCSRKLEARELQSEEEILDVLLEPIRSMNPEISLRLRDPRGRPVPHATVRVTTGKFPVSQLDPAEGFDPYEFSSGFIHDYPTLQSTGPLYQGRLALSSPLTSLELWVDAPGFAIHTTGRKGLDSSGEEEGHVFFELELEPQCLFEGQLVNPQGQPLHQKCCFGMADRDAIEHRIARLDDTSLSMHYELSGHPWITLAPEAWPHLIVVQSDAQGRFRVPGLHRGRYAFVRVPWQGPALFVRADGSRAYGEFIWGAVAEEQSLWPQPEELVLDDPHTQITLPMHHAPVEYEAVDESFEE